MSHITDKKPTLQWSFCTSKQRDYDDRDYLKLLIDSRLTLVIAIDKVGSDGARRKKVIHGIKKLTSRWECELLRSTNKLTHIDLVNVLPKGLGYDKDRMENSIFSSKTTEKL